MALTGPRQCGKTTLAQQLGGVYFDMETLTSNPSAAMVDRLNATADLIDASRRVLVCRIARRIETEKLLVASLPVWLKRLVK